MRAATVGELVGLLMFAAGLLLIFIARDLLGGLWLMFLGWILRSAAASERGRLEMTRALSGLTVGDVMSPQPVILPAAMTCPRGTAP